MAYADLTKCHRLEGDGYVFFTPKMRTDFVALEKAFKGRKAAPTAKPKFSVSGIIKPEYDLGPMKKASEAVAKAAFGQDVQLFVPGKNKGIKNPFSKAEEKLDPARFEMESLHDWTLMRFSSESRPVVVTAAGEEVPVDEIGALAYAGRYMRCEVVLKSYDNESRGVTAYLNRVQLLGNAKQVGGQTRVTGAGDFGVVDDEDEMEDIS